MKGDSTTIASRIGLLLALLVLGTAVLACDADTTQDADDGMASLDNENAECGAAYVDFVSVQEGEGGDFVAIVQGHYPSACDELGDVTQTVRGDVIDITMCSTRPPDEACASVLTPFTETIPIDTEDLDSGEYTVMVNERSENADRTPATLSID